jgi:hypothetical protein
MDVHIHYHTEDHGVLKRLDALQAQLEAQLTRIESKEITMAATMNDLIATITAETVAVTAVELTVSGLAQQVKDLSASGATPAQIQQAMDLVVANKTRIATAALAGTPQAAG